MGTSSADLLLELDRSRPRGLRAQVEAGLRDAIRSGRLAPGTPVPSSRALAADLGITRGVVVDAYDQLVAEGYLAARAGSGTVVNTSPSEATPATPAASTPSKAAHAPGIDIDFKPGLPDLDLFPRAAWLRATRAALQTMPRDDLGYIDPRGLAVLRAALVDHLARVRGVVAHPDRVVVCDGFRLGFGMVAQVLHEMGFDAVAGEDPGYPGVRERLAQLGIAHRGVAIDDEGIDVAALGRSRARVVVVTPAHQAPTGAVLSSARRRELARWAHDVDGYVVEDDYDAEYRYDRHPVGALQGVAPDRVVYCGTSAKSVAPGLRLGWIVLPEALVDPVSAQLWVCDDFTSTIGQATFAAFLTNGDLDRHLRRSRRVYRERRDTIIDALARHLPEAVPSGVSAGLHVLVTLPPGYDEQRIAGEAAARGVRVQPLGAYRTRRRPTHRPGLVLGYGPHPPACIDEGVRRLAAAVASVADRSEPTDGAEGERAG